MKKAILFLSFSVLFFACSAKNVNVNKDQSPSGKEVTIVPAPAAFQDVGRIMKTPGYWISKLQDPDKVILSKKEIDALNAKTLGTSIFISDIQYFKSKYYRKNAAEKHSKMIDIFSKYYDSA